MRKLSDRPPEPMDVHVLYDRGSEGHEADSREDRDSEAIADTATLPSRSIARRALQWSSNWPVRSTM